jgi:tetratricopeptide (TPR) repeat protein
VSYVLPAEARSFFHRALDTASVQKAGWIFRGGLVGADRAAAVFQHRSGRTARLLILHPAAAARVDARTERFAVMLLGDDASATSGGLLSAVVHSLGAVEAEFAWRELTAEEAAASSPNATLRALAPSVARFVAACEEQSAGSAEAALDDIVRAGQTAPCRATAAIVASHALACLHRYRDAFATLEAALAVAAGPARLDLLTRIFSLASLLGFKGEALDALQALLRAAPSDPRFLAHAARFYATRRDYEAAVPHAAALAAQDPARWLAAARTMAQAGLFEDARRATAAGIGEGSAAPDLFAAAGVMGEIGDFNAEHQYLSRALSQDPDHVPSLVRMAQLCLWRGEPEEALRYSTRCLAIRPEEPSATRYRGASALLRGDARAALADLETSARLAPGHPETMVMKGEALLSLGRRAEGLAELERAQGRTGESLTARDLLRQKAEMEEDDCRPSYPQFIEGFVAALPVRVAALERLGMTLDPEGDKPKETIARWLRLVAGNRSPDLTTHVEGRGLLRLFAGDGARSASRALQDLLQTRSPDEVLRRFAEVISRFADKPYPLCYRGELLLWLGRYAEAREDFVSALRIRDDTRWAYVGLGAVELFAERPAAALATLEQGILRAKGAGPTTFAYRGEAYRLLGDLPKAIADLSYACGDWPNRVGAWVNLGLAHGAAEDPSAQERAYRRLLELSPGLLADAAESAGLASAMTPSADAQRRILERARGMMRGNRSSMVTTWYDGAGRLRARILYHDRERGRELECLRTMAGAAHAG